MSMPAIRESAVGTRFKVRSLEELSATVQRLHREGQTIVQCHGVFDLLHIGHIRHFEQAKMQGDVLVVTVTPDRFVNKGPNHPAFGEQLRVEAIAALDAVDYVAINKGRTAVGAIRMLRPDVYAKGSDYRDFSADRTHGIQAEEEAVTSRGGRLFFTDDITFSSSALLNRNLSVLPPETSEYLRSFSERHPTEEVLDHLDKAGSLKAVVVGEAIIDEYHYCQSIGKSGKEPVLASRYVSDERFAGGILAVANHVASFAERVDLLTSLGMRDSHEEFIRQSLDARVQPHFLFQPDAPTIVKRRFVEEYPLQKLFEVYFMNGDHVAEDHVRGLCHTLEDLMAACDLVIVNDYGHGMIGPEMVDLLCDKAPFLAVNTQVNAANQGFNTVSKYRRADYVAVSETELRLDARRRSGDLRQIMLETSESLDCGRIIATQGPRGSLCFSQTEGFFEVPAFTSRIVDRVGAGDAMFAVTALCLANQAPIEAVGMIGNAVGAEAVMTVCNREAIDRVTLCKHITSLLK